MKALGPLAVTAVMPVYNGARYLEQSLASITAQTIAPHEVIVVDDGSADESAEIVERFAAAHPELAIRLHRQANAGQSAARNHAVSMASGELIAFIDQDDQWTKDHLELLTVPFAQDEKIGFAYGDFDEIDGEGSWVVRGYIAAHEVVHPRNSVIQWLASDTMVLPSSAVVRRSAFLGVGGFDPRLVGYEDDDLWVRLFRAGWTSRFVEQSVTAFRVHPESSSRRGSFRESRVIFFEKFSALIPDAPEIHRYYVSDVLLPRIVRSALAEYLGHLRAHRDSEALAVADTIDRVFEIHPSRVLRSRERWLLRRPSMARVMLRSLRSIRTSMPVRLNPGRRLREGYHEWSG